MINKPFADSCVQNQQVILDVLREEFVNSRNVFEIGSGTGQHAIFFARHLPQLLWQCSDRTDSLAGIRAWLDDTGLSNTPPPLQLDVLNDPWPITRYDAIFSANAVHIMGWTAVEAMFNGIEKILEAGGLLCLYGPFNYHGTYTSESNAHFDQWLKGRDPQSGVRDFEALDRLAGKIGLRLINDHAMPANNHILVWQRDLLEP